MVKRYVIKLNQIFKYSNIQGKITITNKGLGHEIDFFYEFDVNGPNLKKCLNVSEAPPISYILKKYSLRYMSANQRLAELANKEEINITKYPPIT